jgi:hypothetical protein
MDPDRDPGGSKTYGSDGSGFGSAKLRLFLYKKKPVCTGERQGPGEGGPAASEEEALRAGQASLRALQYCLLVSTAFS